MKNTNVMPIDKLDKGKIQHTESEIEPEEKLDEYEEMEPEKDKYIIAKPKRIIIRARIKK